MLQHVVNQQTVVQEKASTSVMAPLLHQEKTGVTNALLELTTRIQLTLLRSLMDLVIMSVLQ